MDKLLDFFDDLILISDIEGKILEVNNTFLNIVHSDKNSIIGKYEKDILNIHIQNDYQNNYKKFLDGELTLIYDETIQFDFGNKYFKTRKELIQDKNTTKILITRKDITEQKKYLNLYHSHVHLLEYIAKGKDIEFVLNNIIESVESQNKNMICSILLLDEDKKRLIKAAAPSLPEEYNKKLNGMEIGEKVGSCGAAVYLKKRIIVENISAHENWEKAKYFAAKYNLHACWSQPIFSSENEVLGSFAIYYNTPKKPTIFDIDLIENVANITGIALEKNMNSLILKKELEEKKKREELLAHKSKQAMMGEMIENIAHQWRQPLSIISTSATGILMKKKYGISNEESEIEAFENINLNAQYLSNTIENFRKYFMSDSNKSTFKIMDCLKHTLKLMDSRIKDKNIQIIEHTQDIQLCTYKNELTQVFMNIFNNSIDALEKIDENKRLLLIEIKNDENKQILIKIIDSAQGVDPSILERVFEPYFTTKHKSIGTGIGLYMCHEMIEKHMSGSINVSNSFFNYEDKVYKGLDFEIKLPLNISLQ